MASGVRGGKLMVENEIKKGNKKGGKINGNDTGNINGTRNLRRDTGSNRIRNSRNLRPGKPESQTTGETDCQSQGSYCITQNGGKPECREKVKLPAATEEPRKGKVAAGNYLWFVGRGFSIKILLSNGLRSIHIKYYL
jgi:hypothetical protein